MLGSGSVLVEAPLGPRSDGYEHSWPSLLQALQIGFSSPHLTFRLLHVLQPWRVFAWRRRDGIYG